MNDEDFLLDDEELEDDFILPPGEDEDDEESEYGNDDNEDEDDILVSRPDVTDFEGNLTALEVEMSTAYTLIKEADRKNQDAVSFGGGGARFPENVVNVVKACLAADPKNTAVKAINDYMKEMFHLQAHNRIPASIYAPERNLRGADLGEEFGNLDDMGINEELAKYAREQIAEFVKYLAERDLSKDAAVAKKRKKRQLPAFIIFLFSSGMYDLIINCPTMPPEYDKQIKNAFKRIQQRKYDIVEELAQNYEAAGRNAIAERVRKLGVTWFKNEPNEITSRKSLADLELTTNDVLIYKSIRSKFMNASKTITQDVISDMIEVVLDEKSGLYEKLKDKTRSDAISDVKQVFKDWAKDNGGDPEFINKIIWKAD